MKCEEAKFGLYALQDGELDVAQNLEVLSHLEGCPGCQRELELDRRLKALVQGQLAACTPSPGLWSKIARRIEQETVARKPQFAPFGWLRGVLRRPGPAAWLPQAAWAGLAVGVLASLSLWFIYPREAPPPLVEELVTDHLRSVMRVSGPVDIPAADPAVIVARLRAKVSVPSSMPVLAHGSLKLLGGSFCQLVATKGIRFTYAMGQGRPVSFYQLERSERTPFPRPGAGRVYIGPQQGPGIVLWGDERFLYALVAELPPTDLQQLASHVESL